MPTDTIHAVEMTRNLRDGLYKETKDLDRDDLLRFLQDRGRAALEEARRRSRVAEKT